MDWNTLIPHLLTMQTPALPAPLLARVYLALGWALVLACAGVWLARRLQLSVQGQRVVGLLVLLWCLWPGPWSPTYWLGLAFRAPSLVSALLAGWLLWLLLRGVGQPAPGKAWRYLSISGMVLGWGLLLDTFAVWPVSLYALGFSPAALGAVALLVCLPWLLSGSWPGGGLLLLFLLLAHTLLRLPTGNLWDAVLDPWLWLGLHLYWLLRLWRHWRGARA